MTVQRFADLARDFAARPGARRALRAAQGVLFATVVFFLVVQLSDVGWSAVFSSLPEAPAFYLLFALRYFLQPLSEIPAYQLAWKTPLWRHWTAFIRKRVYNFGVMGYSGEAFFTLWVRRTLGLPDRDILAAVKDNNLISALVSNVATAAVIAALVVLGGLERDVAEIPGGQALLALAFFSAAGLAVAVIVFRRKLIGLPDGAMRTIVALNAGRIAFSFILQAMLYAVALPGAPVAAWTTFIALQLVVSRMPFLPNKDIVFLTAALSILPDAGAPQPAIAGMLLAEAGLSQIFNVGLFALTAHHAVRRQEYEKKSLIAAERPDFPSP